MKKTIIVLAIILMFPIVASAETRYFNDDAGALTYKQGEAVEKKLLKASKECDVDIAILTVNDVSDIEGFADMYFEENYSDNGIIFVVDMVNRTWHMSTSGKSISAFNDDAFDFLESEAVEYLKDEDIYNSFLTFADDASYVQSISNEGKTYRKPYNYLLYLLISIAIGVLGGFGGIKFKKNELKSVEHATTAYGYEDRESLNITGEKEIYLYSQMNMIPLSQMTNYHDSPTHNSPSGIPHGGRGGSF